ncbi:MAG: ATPase [Candidatus Diapherotrites archaeon]|nr:ATPase [Candidatus Diapherotrites archaeon]
MERVPTGVYGLDELIEGGFPRGRTVLLSGGCGTGKTIFSMQYLYKGIVDYGEPGVYVTIDERPELTRQDMLRFGWDLRSLEDQGKFRIVDLLRSRIGLPSEERYQLTTEITDIDRVILGIMQMAREIGAKRLVVDSLPALGVHVSDPSKVRDLVLKLSYMLRKDKLTSIFVSEVPEQQFGVGPMQFSKFGVEEYVADAVILLHYLGTSETEGGTKRTLYIRKMRATKHSEDIIPLYITDNGIRVENPEEAFKA